MPSGPGHLFILNHVHLLYFQVKTQGLSVNFLNFWLYCEIMATREFGGCLGHSGVLRAETSPLRPMGAYRIHSHLAAAYSTSPAACLVSTKKHQSGTRGSCSDREQEGGIHLPQVRRGRACGQLQAEKGPSGPGTKASSRHGLHSSTPQGRRVCFSGWDCGLVPSDRRQREGWRSEEARDEGMREGRDAQRTGYQSKGPSLLQTVTHLEDILGTKFRPLGDLRCHSSEEGIQM